MSYQSFAFLLFSAVTLILYYISGRHGQKWVLAAANLFFFVSAGAKYLPYLAVTALVTYLGALCIGRVYKKADEKLAAAETQPEKKEIRKKAKSKAKCFLLLSMLVAVGLLAYCKYAGFFTENLNRVLLHFGVPQIETFKTVLPIGISFYTFMALSYILDVYWKRYTAEKNPLTYAVYLSYFPHVVQGPIDRFNEFKEQIKDGVKLSYRNITFGAQLTLWGFFKKLVIADRLGIVVDKVIAGYADYDGIIVILALLLYSIQIYADFSGCIDIVSGISEMFGIKLRRNFNHPYFSRTMAEFWRRWHISLQEWFKDYIYYPVSASALTKKVKKFFKKRSMKRAEELFSSCFPILVVWLITGIWHGAAWKFVVWGLFHAALLIGSLVFEPVFKFFTRILHLDTDNFGWRFIQMARTFLLCCVGRIFFRADSLAHGTALIKKMVTDTTPAVLAYFDFTSFGFSWKMIFVLCAALLVLLVGDILQENISVRETLAKSNLVFRWSIMLLGLIAVIIFGVYGPGYDAASFIYEQF
ncbi:MAG: MBOAT family protein [Clostridia bacterium]|nr:MBOAT family protein [Clostridia bacterium]